MRTGFTTLVNPFSLSTDPLPSEYIRNLHRRKAVLADLVAQATVTGRLHEALVHAKTIRDIQTKLHEAEVHARLLGDDLNTRAARGVKTDHLRVAS